MTKLAMLLYFGLFTSVSVTGEANSTPNPDDFKLKVHITSSAVVRDFGDSNVVWYQVLEATIDSEPVQLQDGGARQNEGVLALGDYSGRVSPNAKAPRGHSNTYDVYRSYDLLLPDGTTRSYGLTRLGPPMPR